MARNTRNRTAELEPKLAILRGRVQAMEALLAQSQIATDDGGRRKKHADARSRRELLKLAGAAAAGIGAATLVRTRDALAASQTMMTETNMVTNAPTKLSGTSPFSTTNGASVFKADATPAIGTLNGIEAIGSGTASGVAAGGGAMNGAGVLATGGGSSGPGIIAVGASGGSSYGVVATGMGLGQGVAAYGGSGGGQAIYAAAGGTGTGIEAHGGTGQNGHGIRTFGGGVGGMFSGNRAAINLQSNATAGPPAAGFHEVGDVYADNQQNLWVCLANGEPGTFRPLQPGGLNQSVFTAASTSQYLLQNSDGTAWVDVDATNLALSITPAFNSQARLSANADMWTANAGFNQDLGIFISGGAYGTGQIVAWKESGGFAGTYSPNAAFVETLQPLAAGTAYTIKVRWKTNHGGSSTIVIGAGASAPFSPTRLTAQLVVSA